jgi:mRNA-degrading endonuclease RelE of RelBE toxin-antitoxin system
MPELRWHPNVARLLASLPDGQRDRIRPRVRALSLFPFLGPPQPGASTGLRRLVALGWKVVYSYDQASDVVTVLVMLPPRSSIDLSD